MTKRGERSEVCCGAGHQVMEFRKITYLGRRYVVLTPVEFRDSYSRYVQVFNARDWEDMHLKYIVPKLGALLRDEFQINPRNQQLDPLKNVLAWSGILRQSITGQLLETGFFPKWLDVLHIWLIQPTANFDEIGRWYKFWKETFPEDVQTIPAVEQGGG